LPLSLSGSFVTPVLPSGPPRRALTARLSVPLSIPIATDLVRPPRPEHGLDSLGVLCAQPLGAQAKQTSSAVQALVSRASCTQATEQHLTSLSDQMSTLDVAMATLVDGMCRLDQVLWEAAKPAELPGSGGSVVPSQPAAAPRRVGGWVRLKPSYRSLLATASAQSKSKSKFTGGSSSSTNINPQLFRAGMVAEHEEMLNRRAAAAEAASTSHFTATSSSGGATVPASGAPSSSSSSSSANKHARLSPLNASVNETEGVLSSSSSASSATELAKSPVARGGAGGGEDGGVVSTASAPRMFSPPTPQLLQGRKPGPP